jgi:hypothetical protein
MSAAFSKIRHLLDGVDVVMIAMVVAVCVLVIRVL